jgi:hypothetical protein
MRSEEALAAVGGCQYLAVKMAANIEVVSTVSQLREPKCPVNMI